MTASLLNYSAISRIVERIEIPIMLYLCFVTWMMDDTSSLYQLHDKHFCFKKPVIPTEPVLLFYIFYIYPSLFPHLSQNPQA